MSSILDLDVLLTRIASLTKRLIDYRTFGILLLNEATQELDMKFAVRYGEDATSKRVKLGQGLVGWAAQHKEPVLVSDVSKDPRYLNLVPDARSELVIPMLIKDRCIGVFDLESPELDAFTKEHKELLTLLASQAAVAIENARLYEEVRRNEERIEKELRFAQRVQVALLPTELPAELHNADVAGRFEPAHELGGDLHDFLAPEPDSLVVAVGDVSGKGAPAALYGAFRRRTGPLPDAAPPLHARPVQRGGRAAVDEQDPARATARGVLLHAVLRLLRLQGTGADDVELRAAVSDPLQRGGMRADRTAGRAARIVCRRHLRRSRRSRSTRETSSCSARMESSRR